MGAAEFVVPENDLKMQDLEFEDQIICMHPVA